MKNTDVIYAGLIIVQIGIVIFFFRWNKLRAKRNASQSPGVSSNAYEEFRNVALAVQPHQLKIAIPNSETLVYGVIMDWDMGDMKASLATYITGACNLYSSNGSNYTGGGNDPSIAESAVEFVTAAQKYLDKTVATTSAGLPGKECVRFYLLINQRMYMAEEQMSNFEQGTSVWMPLFEKGNTVIAGIRGSMAMN